MTRTSPTKQATALRIAEASSISGLSIDTIRYYEKTGMLPSVARGHDGHRRFTAENVDWLTVLYWLRATGMTMKVMHRYATLVHAGDHTIPERKKILRDHGDKLNRRRADLDRCAELLAYKLDAYETVERRNSADE